MQDSSSEFPAPFRALLDRFKTEVDAGDLARAQSSIEEAIAWGVAHSDRDAVDRAVCNRAGVTIYSRDGDSVRDAIRELQTVLMRSAVPSTRYAAAYNLSFAYHERKQYDRSSFYGRLALDSARCLSNRTFEVKSLNRLGRTLGAQSYFEDALQCFHDALEIPDVDDLTAALLHANVGYCNLVLERIEPGFSSLYAALRTLRQPAYRGWEQLSGIHLTLCYGHIVIERLGHARRHGEKSLALAAEAGDEASSQKALYLLGELEKQAGFPDRAYAYFERLQAEHYAQLDDLPELLMSAQTHQLVNLMA